ncbi:helix-turn-helix domain-containing protein [Sphingomonas sp. S-NIH.Pt1_0416]|jgi:DNA-binding transcriptional MocR family regulator|uniref:helix-turn-helix domain-containing protein n=1 Tax=Sphingomonas sp. S-NIH.Pt1_0416 TaxID=1920123 RepID=UPI000F7E6D46|nr:helix-turn-helix domain-containing protein [Sphingomonas sp. S-NIH.Pt1_0416]RSU57056.1 helix-turn-helix domain-containing protein [Sphingomonas sp. S-NIH.Pt1_0416]
MALPAQKPKGHWVQTDRSSHEAWAALTRKSPLAAQVMHLLAARVGDHNAVVISQGTLAKLAGASRRGVQNAIAVLERERWIELRQIGDRGTVNAHVINDRVVWTGSRDGLRTSLFSAVVVLSDTEQPDREDLGAQQPLRRLPRLFPGERQMPAGEGEPPPSEPSLPGMEPDLPALHEPADREPVDEARAIGSIAGTLLSRLGDE